jgi:hypothetical protein
LRARRAVATAALLAAGTLASLTTSSTCTTVIMTTKRMHFDVEVPMIDEHFSVEYRRPPHGEESEWYVKYGRRHMENSTLTTAQYSFFFFE